MAARSYQPVEARRRIKEGAVRALKRVRDLKPFVIPKPGGPGDRVAVHGDGGPLHADSRNDPRQSPRRRVQGEGRRAGADTSRSRAWCWRGPPSRSPARPNPIAIRAPRVRVAPARPGPGGTPICGPRRGPRRGARDAGDELRRSDRLRRYLASLDDDDLRRACTFLAGRPFPRATAAGSGSGWAAIVGALRELVPASPMTELGAAYRRTAISATPPPPCSRATRRRPRWSLTR